MASSDLVTTTVILYSAEVPISVATLKVVYEESPLSLESLVFTQDQAYVSAPVSAVPKVTPIVPEQVLAVNDDSSKTVRTGQLAKVTSAFVAVYLAKYELLSKPIIVTLTV